MERRDRLLRSQDTLRYACTRTWSSLRVWVVLRRYANDTIDSKISIRPLAKSEIEHSRRSKVCVNKKRFELSKYKKNIKIKKLLYLLLYILYLILVYLLLYYYIFYTRSQIIL